MLNLSLMALVIFSGVLTESFRLADADPDHHQVLVRVAMAPDGRFVVAWVDSLVNLSASPDYAEFEMFVRFFDSDGTPLTEAQQITKVADSNRMYWPDLAVDSAGNTVLLWAESRNRWGEDGHIRFKMFDRDGIPLDSSRTVADSSGDPNKRTVAVSRNSQGEFAIGWASGGVIRFRRYAADGTPQGDAFRAHDEFAEGAFMYPEVALNDVGDLVVTWLNFANLKYPLFQVFDAQNSSILPWEPEGHRLDDRDTIYATRIEPHWLDEDRFVTFWAEISPGWMIGRVFSEKGQIRHPMQDLYHDSYQKDSFSIAAQWGGPYGWFSSALRSDGRFALTHTRSYVIINDTSFDAWYHQVGTLGAIEDNEPQMQTALFEYSPPYGADTAGKDYNMNVQAPAVACCDDRIVWVYSRFNTDTIFEAWAIITDWDMVGIEEPVIAKSPFKLEAFLNRLAYEVPGEAVLTLYNSAGRRIDEEVIHGQGSWQAVGIPSGVYFARVESEGFSQRAKVVVLR